MPRIFTVSQLNGYISGLLDDEIFLRNIVLRGEIMSVNISGGTAYLEVTDGKACIECVYFNPPLKRGRFLYEPGDVILMTGSPKFYVKGGKISFRIVSAAEGGEGDRLLGLKRLRARLDAEGVFSRMRPLPATINKIGVVSGAGGVVIHDIISVAQRRNPQISICLYPVRIQGEGAEVCIASAISELDSLPEIDLIIVARGGGSSEDLSCFNTEEVARAVFGANKIIVSAVGHETDYTLCDFAADLRAPTPSAAAELCVRPLSEKLALLHHFAQRLSASLDILYSQKSDELRRVGNNFSRGFGTILNNASLRFVRPANLLTNSATAFLARRDALVDSYRNLLKAASPLRTGFARLTLNGREITSAAALSSGDEISIYFEDGKKDAVIK